MPSQVARITMSLLIGWMALTLGGSASALVIDWTFVGSPGNPCDGQPQGCFGSVAYPYTIGTYEVTNSQYAEFLNAVADTDTFGLYSAPDDLAGVTRSGSSGSYSYSTIAGRSDMPVVLVSFYSALRFANWLHNGQPTGAQGGTTTEDGAYTLTQQGIDDNSIVRNPGAVFAVTNEDEWYKAAYYAAATTSYFDYPAGSDTTTTCASPTATPNRANCDQPDFADAGSYTGSASPYGTFDQGGNVFERNESIINGSNRGVRGGDILHSASRLVASDRGSAPPDGEYSNVGFRVVPEPAVRDVFVILGMLGIGYLEKRRAVTG